MYEFHAVTLCFAAKSDSMILFCGRIHDFLLNFIHLVHTRNARLKFGKMR